MRYCKIKAIVNDVPYTFYGQFDNLISYDEIEYYISQAIDLNTDDVDDEDSIDIAITEACGAWYDDEAIGHPNKAIRDGVKHQPRFMSKEGEKLSCDTEKDFEVF